jgi:hypothetical protein
MSRKIIVLLVVLLVFFTVAGTANAGKVSIFNFGTVNLDASGLGTTVTNVLANSLKNDADISLLERKDLETFLSFNDLQQNDQLDNVVDIGSKLALDFIIVGSVEKRGSFITINCQIVQIDKKQIVYNTRVTAFGETALNTEIAKLGALVVQALRKNGVAGTDEKAVASCPVNFQKFPGTKKIVLRWQEITGFFAVGYEIYRAFNLGGPFAMLGQTDKTEYSDQNVQNGITYFYKVRAFDKRGRASEFSPVIDACPDFAPNPPIILKTEGRAKSVLLVWVSNPSKSQDTAKLSGYRIYRAKSEEDTYQEITQLSVGDLAGSSDGKMYYRDKALLDGSTYFYRVVAFNEKNIESDFSHPLKGTVLPNINSVNAQSGLIREVKLSWVAVKSPFVVGYNIYRSFKADGNFIKIKRINAAEAIDNFAYSDIDGLGDKKNYFYYVTAEDDVNVETKSSPVVAALTRDIPPQPGNFTARSSLVKKVELTWLAAKEEEVEGYNIYWSPEKDGRYDLLKKIIGRENSKYLDESRGFENLGDKKTYYYRLTAFNKVAAESLPAEAIATTKPRPQNPAGLKGEALKVKEVPLNWQANTETDIVTYYIYRSAGEKDNFSNIGRTDKSVYTDKGLKDGTTYYYKVQAEDKDGLLSDQSGVIAVSTKPRPHQPEGLMGHYQAGKAELSWKPGKESDISLYIIYEKKFFGLEKMAEAKSTNYTDNSVAPGKSKTYIVTAIDRDGLESEPSVEMIVTAK